MLQARLLKLLKSLSKEEFFRFGKFLRSPFFNNTPSLIQFYETLKKYHPEFESKKLDSEKLWKKVFPEKDFTKQRFWRLCSDLSLQVEQYLTQLELERSPKSSKQLFVKSLGRRNVYDIFEKEIQKRQKQLNEIELKDADWYQEQLDLLIEYFNHPLKKKYIANDPILPNILDNLDASYTLQKMRYSNNHLNVHRIFPSDYEIQYLDVLLKQGAPPVVNQNLLFLLYKKAIELLGDEVESFQSYEKLLFENINNLQGQERTTFYYSGLNYTMRKINQGQTNFNMIALRWYKFGLQKGIFIVKGIISDLTFRNIVHVACNEKEFHWAETFIEDYQQFLNPNQREYLVAFNKGMIAFSQKKLDQAIAFLSLEYTPTHYLLITKNALIRCLFEKYLIDESYFEILHYNIDAFEIQLLRNKAFRKGRNIPHLNLIRILRMLSKKISNNTPANSIEVWATKQFLKRKKVISKTWLIDLMNWQKIGELSKA